MELSSSQESTVFEYENIASLIYRQNNSCKFKNFQQILKINPAIHDFFSITCSKIYLDIFSP